MPAWEQVVKHHYLEKIGKTHSDTPWDGYLLCLNAGSSSLKFKLYDISQKPLAVGWIKLKEVNDDGGKRAIAQFQNTEKGYKLMPQATGTTELSSPSVLPFLLRHLGQVLDDKNLGSKVKMVAHRIVHGADLPQCITVSHSDQHHLETLEFLAEFAPLHNAVSVGMIRNCLECEELPRDHKNYCCFDTGFHHTIEPQRWRYMVDDRLAGESLPGGMRMRKWGFHGLSYSSILETLSKYLNKPKTKLNVILCHLGSGSSMCAVANGQSVDTTMGLTPLEGLPGATRSGSVDPVLALHISNNWLKSQGQEGDAQGLVEIGGGLRVSHAELVLNKQSGFKAVASTSDFEEVCKRRQQWLQQDQQSYSNANDINQKAALAFDIFLDRIVGYLGDYYFKLCAVGRVDALVLSGGIGEASHEVHQALAERLEQTPLAVGGDELYIHPDSSDRVKCVRRKDIQVQPPRPGHHVDVPWLICKTDEEAEMARQVVQIWSH